jgi:hypothetical protein
MNTTVVHLMQAQRITMQGTGTSEGVAKSWETRKSGGAMRQTLEKAKNWMRDKASRIAESEERDDPSAQEGTPRGVGVDADASMEAREFSQKKRKKLAKSGAAMPHGGFPIVNRQDLKNAERAIGRAKNPAAARRHINERAKALGAKPIGAEVAAYGTSEGAEKGWDTRGRASGSKLRDNVKQGRYRGGWKQGGRNEGSGYMGYHTSFYDHPKHGLLEIKHGGPWDVSPISVKHNGAGVFTGGSDRTKAFLRKSYGIRYQ